VTFLCSQGHQRLPLDKEDHCVGDRFDVEQVSGVAPTEYVSGQIERRDVTAPVFESLAASQNASDHEE